MTETDTGIEGGEIMIEPQKEKDGEKEKSLLRNKRFFYLQSLSKCVLSLMSVSLSPTKCKNALFILEIVFYFSSHCKPTFFGMAYLTVKLLCRKCPSVKNLTGFTSKNVFV